MRTFFLVGLGLLQTARLGSSVDPACPQPHSAWRHSLDMSPLDFDESKLREAFYNDRCRWLDDWNRAHAGGDFRLGPNPRFADLSPQELAALRPQTSALAPAGNNNGPGPGSSSEDLGSISSSSTLPAQLDWRESSGNPRGIVAVTSVKDQGGCGACWSFSVIATLEAAVALSKVTVEGAHHKYFKADASSYFCRCNELKEIDA